MKTGLRLTAAAALALGVLAAAGGASAHGAYGYGYGYGAYEKPGYSGGYVHKKKRWGRKARRHYRVGRHAYWRGRNHGGVASFGKLRAGNGGFVYDRD